MCDQFDTIEPPARDRTLKLVVSTAFVFISGASILRSSHDAHEFARWSATKQPFSVTSYFLVQREH